MEYPLSPASFGQGESAVENAGMPVLRDLRDRTGETAQLWVRRGDERVCLLSADSQHELRAILPPGSRLPLPQGSSGRVLAGDEDALAQLQSALPCRWPASCITGQGPRRQSHSSSPEDRTVSAAKDPVAGQVEAVQSLWIEFVKSAGAQAAKSLRPAPPSK